ncbi:MAG: GAF domain-containing protein, partial [Opitutaceae bacterium]
MSADPVLAVSVLAARAACADEALPLILRTATDAFQADSGAIALLNPDSTKLEIEAGRGLPGGEIPALSLGQGIPGWAAFHAKPVLAADVAADPRYRAIRPGVRCQMAAPLLAAEGQPVGVLSVESDRPRAFG